MNRTIALLIFVSFGLSNPALSQPAQPRPIVDGTGVYGKTLVQKLSTDVDGRQRRNVHPFVIGYCGWRVRTLTNYSITKFEGMQLGLCKTILDFFDPQVTTTLSSIETRADNITNGIEITDAESKAIQDYVVMKYGMFYMGVTDDTSAKPDPVARWKYYAGANLGELAGHLTLWWRIWNEPKFDLKVASILANIDEKIRSAPKNADAAFIADLKALNLFGVKTKFTPAERVQINQLLTRALQTSVALTALPNIAESIPNNAAFARSMQINPSTEKTAGEIFESAKAKLAKSDFKNALAEFDQAAKLNPRNGVVYFHRALAKEKLGLLDEAINDYNAVIMMKLSLKEAHFNRGTIYLNKKDYKLAISDFNTVIALDPKYDAAFYNRGLAYYNSQQLFAALGDFTTAIKLKPLNANAFLMRSYVYCAQGAANSAMKDQEAAAGLGATFERGCK